MLTPALAERRRAPASEVRASRAPARGSKRPKRSAEPGAELAGELTDFEEAPAYLPADGGAVMVFEPLVITASPPLPIYQVSGEDEAIESEAEGVETAVIETQSKTDASPTENAEPVPTAQKPEPAPSKVGAATPRDAAKPTPPAQTGADGVMRFEADVITARPPDAAEPTPQAQIGADGVMRFEPDVITARPPEQVGAPGVASTEPALANALAPSGDQTSERGKPGDEKKVPGAQTKPDETEAEGAEEGDTGPAEPLAEEEEAEEPAPEAETGEGEEAPDEAAGPTGGGGGEEGDLDAWKSRVADATEATPEPTLDEGPDQSAAQIESTGKSASARRGGGGGAAMTEDAKKAVRKPPETPKQLPPPPPTPVPAADKAIADASDKRLPDQSLPQLVQRAGDASVPKPTVPEVDTQFAADIGSKIDVPGADPAPEAPDKKSPTDKKQKKLKDAKAKEPEVGRKGKPGQPMTLTDTAPPLTPGVEVGTKGQSKEKVSQVLAELVRSPGPEGEAVKIVNEARSEAYPRKALEMECPEMGTEKKDDVVTELKAQVDSIRAIAGISAAELDTAIKTREENLKALETGAKVKIETATKGAKKDTKDSGEKTAEEIAGTRDAMDEATIQKVIAASGEGDPQVIELRRDKAIRGLTSRAARQDVYYEQAGARRTKALDAAKTRMRNAYKKAAEADEKQIYDRIFDEEKKKADQAAKEKKTKANYDAAKETATKNSKIEATPIYTWSTTQTLALDEAFTTLKEKATADTKKLRDRIKGALDTAKGLLRDWAEDLISREENWIQGLIRMFKEWMKEAIDDSAAWEAARNEQLRDALVGDLQMIDDLQAAAQSGVDMKAFVQERGLDQAQMSVLQTYFARVGPKGKEQFDAIGAVAAGMRMRVRMSRKPGIISWFKSEVMGLPDSKWRLMGRIGNAEKPPFNAFGLASELHEAMDQWGTDEDKIFRALAGLTPIQARAIRACYQEKFHRSLDEHLDSEMSGAELTRAEALLKGNQTVADVATLYEAMHGGLTGIGTDEDAIMTVLRNKTPEEREAIVAEYKKRYGIDLNADLKDELDDGWGSNHDAKRADALMEGDTAKADAIALDAAMHGGLTGAGTDEAEITRIYEQNRAEVEAEAARKGWSTAQMDAEIRRRNKAIEDKYEVQYGDPEKKDGQPSALRKAFDSELSGAELGLANALAEGDMTKIDAAKLGVEKESFITSDETVNKILQSQHERAKKDVTRDVNYDLRFREEMDSLRGEDWTPEKRKAEREKADKEIKDQTKKRAMTYMGNLETTFDKEWGGGKGGLVVMIAFNMSGTDQKKAWDLRAQGGLLEPEQEIQYAIEGIGTDVDKLKEVLKGKSPDEIKAIRKAWAERYKRKEEEFDEEILDEVSGRDYQDIKWGLEGEPQTPDGKLARAKERMQYEKDAYGVWGDYKQERASIEEEYKYLGEEKDRLAKLEAEKPVKREGESEEAFAARMDEYSGRKAYWEDSFKLQEGYFDQSIENHRKAVDSFADTVATIASIVAVIVVMAVVAFFTAGTGAAAIGAALASAKVAAAAAIAAAAATMATKALIKGSTYSHGEMAMDAIVGAVDAIASAATAGVGGGLLKAARAGAPASKLASWAAKTRLASGLSKMATSERMAARIFAGAMAEGIEGVASSLPSALAGNMLDEKNWVHGSPLVNILQGTAMQTGIGALVSGGMGGLGGIGKHVDDVADNLPVGRETGDILGKRGTPAERLTQWKAWKVDNPGKPYKQFLEELDSGIIAREADDAAEHAMQRQMRSELLSAIPPAQRGEFVDVPIHVMSDADFERFTRSASGQAVVIFKDGKPMVIMREGADIKALREEGIHLLQSKDPKFAKKFADLDEARLADWDKLGLDEQLGLYRTKLDIELDGQARLIKGLDDQIASIDDPALRKALIARRDAAVNNLDNLKKRLGEVDGLDPADRLKIARGEMTKPQYLDQKPRLFAKPDPKIESLLTALKGEFDDKAALTELRAVALKYDRRVTSGVIKNPRVKGSVIDRVSLFFQSLVGMAATSKTEATSLLRSMLNFFQSIDISAVAPFLAQGAQIYKAAGDLGDKLFDNLQRIAASGTFGPTKIGKIGDALDHIMKSVDPKRFEKADAFVRDIREAVDHWNQLQKQLNDIKALEKAGAAEASLKSAKEFASSIGEDVEKKIAKLDAYGIADAKLLDEIKAEIKNTGRWEWGKFRVQLGKDFPKPTSFGELEDLIKDVGSIKHWDAADIGPIRRWAGIMEELHKSLEGKPTGTNLQKFFKELADPSSPFRKFFTGGGVPDFAKGTPQQKLMLALGHLIGKFDAGYKAGSYDKLRYFILDAVIAATMDLPNPAAQFKFLKESFLDKLRKFDSASVGEYFSAYRRAILDADDSLPVRGDFVGVKGLPDAKRALKAGEAGRMVDGAAEIGRDLTPNGPFKGSRSLIEDKAGKSYDPTQVKNYSKILKDAEEALPDRPPSIPTADGDFHGVIYFFEDMTQAGKRAEEFDKMGIHWSIQVASIDKDGVLRIVPRDPPIKPPKEKLDEFRKSFAEKK